MKNLFYLLFALPLMFSCGDDETGKKKVSSSSEESEESEEKLQGYRIQNINEMDTSYQRNSVEISDIDIEFMKCEYGDYETIREMTFTECIYDYQSEYTQEGRIRIFISYWINENLHTGLTSFDAKEDLLNFFDNVNTVLDNPDKDLSFDFGLTGLLYYLQDAAQVNIGRGDESVSFPIDKKALDNMQECFNKYLEGQSGNTK